MIKPISIPGTRYYRNWRKSILAMISMPFDNISHFFELSKGSETLTFCFVCKLLLSLLVAPLNQGFKDFKNTQLKHPVASKTRHWLVNCYTVTLKLFTLKLTNKLEEFTLQYSSSTEGWSGEGCYVRKMTSSETECVCNHLTHFAVLMDFTDDGSTAALVS